MSLITALVCELCDPAVENSEARIIAIVCVITYSEWCLTFSWVQESDKCVLLPRPILNLEIWQVMPVTVCS